MIQVRRYRVVLLAAAVALLAAVPIRAEQAPSVPAAPETALPADREGDGAKTTGPDPEKVPPRPGDAAVEIFVPSEEISEDFAVSFPVDI